jgi:hypothetical protein
MDDYGNDLVDQYGWLVVLFAYYGEENFNNDGYLCEYY